MKHIFRSILVYSVAIAVTSLFLPGIDYGNRISTLLLTAVVMGISNTFIRPILNLILLPINIITLGLVGLLMNAIILFIVTLLVPDFNIIPFSITLGSNPIYLSLIWSYLVSATILSFISNTIRKIVNP
jgi:putative membrane protein